MGVVCLSSLKPTHVGRKYIAMLAIILPNTKKIV